MSSCSWTRNVAGAGDVAGGGIEVSNNEEPKEIVMFCGNPGVGKSSLMNSILQSPEFTSGTSIGGGLTTESQSRVYDGVKYMDTPGLSDVKLRKQAAAEIEKALKQDGNYKVVFVITLEGGRIRPDDLTTINLVCDAVKGDFKYGIVINKVTKRLAEQVNQESGNWAPYLVALEKKPESFVIINKDEEMEDANNTYLPAKSENRKKLLDFIAELPSNGIPASAVSAIKEDRFEAMQEKMTEQLATITQQMVDMRSDMKKLEEKNDAMTQKNKEIQEDLDAERKKKCIVM